MAVFLPKLLLKDVTQIDTALLKKHGIKALILDVDNTLTRHGSQQVESKVIGWLSSMKAAGIPLMLVSNNSNSRIKPFAERLGLAFVARGMKPLSGGLNRAATQLRCHKEHIAVVGDQIYTDVLGGNVNGMFTILVTPFESEQGAFFRLKRFFERGHLKRYHKLQERSK